MYKHDSRQIGFHDQPHLFGGLPLNESNRWVKLAGVIPWVRVETEYKKNFKVHRGEQAKSARLALGCLIVKEQLQLSDRDTVEMIRENPYIQYFLGFPDYQYDLSLDASLLTHFRKRFPADVIARVNQWIVDATLHPENDDINAGGDDSGNPSLEEASEPIDDTPDNRGTLILDASCAPQDIQYPTDVRLLHESRKKLEEMMDTLQEGRTEAKPRHYRQKANREYNRFSRNRRPTKKQIREALRKQLQYVARDLRLVADMRQDSAVSLDDNQLAYLATILQLYEQQQSMYDNKTRRCADRIVSIHQPHVRPIVRGKATVGTEFGAKFTAMIVDGYAEVCNLSWDAYNESQDLITACEQYKERHGQFPERVLADKIFRTRKNLQYCKDRDIHLNGPPLGRPPKDPHLLNEQIRLEREESGERNAIEGKFGEGKRRFSLGLVMTKLKATSETQIHLSFLVMNLQKILRDLFVSLFIDLFPANHRWFSPAVV